MSRVLGRIALAAIFFALAAFFAYRAWNPLGNGYFAANKDTPDGVYFTMAAIGFTVATLFAAMGLVILWRWSQRYGFLVVAVLSIAASLLPALLFKWDDRSDTWPWVFAMHGHIGWLRFHEPQHWVWMAPRWLGLSIQAVLGGIAVAAVAAHGLRGGGAARPVVRGWRRPAAS
jgi:hypothetical protein